jgi:NAD-dependent deacetylase
MTVQQLLSEWRNADGDLLFLTGAGVSAESGIPTFRGEGGFWRVGSQNYTPEALATKAMFRRAPSAVWSWYLARLAQCASAKPNRAHDAIARIQNAFPTRVSLITQNVDGLHRRAGSPEQTTFEIHGQGWLMRCSKGCGPATVLPADLASNVTHPNNDDLPKDVVQRLHCPECDGWMRPNVLWFDEYYDEPHYRADSALTAVNHTTLLITVGTTGSTSLPVRIGESCADRHVPIIDVNIEDNTFSSWAKTRGLMLRASASSALPQIAKVLEVAMPGGG